MRLRPILFVAAGAAILGLAACGGAASSATSGGGADKGAAAASTSGDVVTMYVFAGEDSVKGPDGQFHDAFIPSSAVLHVGKTTTFHVISYDDMPHSITAPDLGINQIITPGTASGDNVTPATTTFTITPAKAGVFRWHCVPPCDTDQNGWAMSDGYGGKGQEGFMAGNFVVLE